MLDTADPVNFSALDALKSVLGVDFPELIRDFNHLANDCLLKLEIAVAQSDSRAIQSLAHTLRGAALSLHAKPLADRCSELENVAYSSDTSMLNVHIQHISLEVKEVISAIEEWAYR